MNSRRQITIFLLAFFAVAMPIRAQENDAINFAPKTMYYSSSYVVNPFRPFPPLFSILSDTLTTPRGILEVQLFKPIESVSIDDNWEYITITETVQDELLKLPFTVSLDWYMKYRLLHDSRFYFQEKLALANQKNTVGSTKRGKAVELIGVDLGDFGRASLRVNGNVNITGKLINQNQELKRSTIAETQATRFDIDQKQHLSIEGTIGDRISVVMDQDSERDFDWENNIRVTYTGEEDEILQKIEAGNTSLSLPATQYVTFTGRSQGLFGVKAISKLGPIDITSVAAVEQTKKAQQEYKGSGQAQTQKIKDYEYIKNQYFFVHEWFRNGVSINVGGKPIQIEPYYPLSDEGLHYFPNVRVADFELYKLDQTNNPAADLGTAYIDPSNPNDFQDDNKDGSFLRMERDLDYFVSEDLGYIRLKNRSQEKILACHYLLLNRTTGDTVLSVGQGIIVDDSTSTLKLKMLKPQSPRPNHPTWDLMFKNVYYLGTTNIDSSGFAVRIINNQSNLQSDRNKNGTPYIQLFDMDNRNENGEDVSDERIDAIDNIISMGYGELHFPALLPFASVDSIAGGNTEPDLLDELGDGKMYTSTISSEYIADHHFTIEADYSNKSSTINLGFMIRENSETVTINGGPQTKGVDYSVDYFTGTITMLKSDIDPNADINVKYEKNELVSFDKKVILGSRAQMDIGENAFIGATALWYNQTVIDEKVEVGYEPMRNFIWDVNGRYHKDMERLTHYIDRLPFLQTDALSSFSIEGEFAQVFPNPNSLSNSATGDLNGVAFIDDFEGAKRSSSPPLMYYNWDASSAPLDTASGISYNQRNRSRMFWFNPKLYSTKNIWPKQSTSIHAGNQNTTVLFLNNKIRPHQNTVDSDSVWAGIITNFSSGYFDQTQSKFFEIWVQGEEGKLTVDLGEISEDWNGDNKLNNEDKPEAGLALGDGFLDEGEDIGLDGCINDFEDGWGGCLDTLGLTYKEYLANGETDLINAQTENIDDPNGDDWINKETNNYPEVNGTEGNKLSPGGTYPDTEDLDGSLFLDKTNNFFTKTFSLTESEYFVSETETNEGEKTGWRQFRIPLAHFGKVNSAEWGDIRYIRLVWSGIADTSLLGIAKIELVGNNWQELGIAAEDAENFTKLDSAFAITVINTEDDPGYVAPQGVTGEYNPIYQQRSKEQSLVLKFENLPGKNRGAAKKTLFSLSGERAQSYLTYEKMKMYVYGESDWIESDETNVEVFMQFGMGNQYYEITQPVYDGWDEDQNRNSIELDLDWLTKLKLQDSTNVSKFRESDVFRDSADVKEYFFTDEQGVLTGKRIKIVGAPALSRIQHFIAGVKNTSDIPISGQVWLDELRLSGVKQEKGIAMRMQSNLQIADFGKTSIIFSRKDADFHVLQQRLGTNQNSQDIRINSNFQLQKFMPKSWGLMMPLNVTYANMKKLPKFYPGTDVRVTESAAPDSIQNRSETFSLSTSLAKRGKSKSKWMKYTVDNITANFSANSTTTSNEIMKEVHNESYVGKLAYNYSFGRDNFFKPFKWLAFVPYIGEKISETNFFYTPSSVNAGIDFAEKLVQKNSRNGGRTPDEYNFGLNRMFKLDYKLSDNLDLRYNSGAKSDMDEYRATVWKAIQKFDPGIVTNTNENFNASYNPALLKWLKPSFTYSTQYRWDQPLNSTIDGANIGSNIKFTGNASVNLAAIMETFYKPTDKSKDQSSGGSTRRRRGKPAEEESEEPSRRRRGGAVEEQKEKEEKPQQGRTEVKPEMAGEIPTQILQELDDEIPVVQKESIEPQQTTDEKIEEKPEIISEQVINKVIDGEENQTNEVAEISNIVLDQSINDSLDTGKSEKEDETEPSKEPDEKPSIYTKEKEMPAQLAKEIDEITPLEAQEIEDELLEEEEYKPKKKFNPLVGIHSVLKKINPINVTYTSDQNRTGLGVQGTVPIGYKFGWLDEHGLPHSEKVGTNTGQWKFQRRLTLRTGFSITTKANVNLTYGQDLGINRSGAGLEQHSLTRDYFAYGERLDKGLPFSSWTLRVTGLEKWPLLKKFAKTASLEHAFSGKEVRSWKIEGLNVPTTSFFAVNSFAKEFEEHLIQSRINANFSPLIGLTMSLAKGITMNVRYNASKTAEKRQTGLTIRKESSISMSSNYAHKGGFTIPLPFMENWKVQNTMNFTFNADYNNSETFGTKNSTELSQTSFNNSWKTGLRVSYSFSSRITGAVILEYRESDSKVTGKKIDRDIGFDLNLAISG